MEHNRDILNKALQQLPSYEPKDIVWHEIDQKLNELPLQQALPNLPEYEPDQRIWRNIEHNVTQKGQIFPFWKYVAAVLFLGCSIGFWLYDQNQRPLITYSEETVDQRLQVSEETKTDGQYKILKAWCESETVVCNSVGFKQLTEEYEILQLASKQLQDAMGHYNAEPELMKQLSMVEQEKAGILNKMAKMI